MTALDGTDIERRDALVERLFGATIGALEMFSVHLGWRLGLYRALADHGPLDADGLARAAAIDPRYAREWLEQQAVAGLLDVVPAGDDPPADRDGAHTPDGPGSSGDAAAPARRFSLPPGHREVLAEPEQSSHVAPFAPLLVGIAGALPHVVEAYRTGAGVPYTTYGPDFRDGQGAINRPAFTHELPGWLASIPDLHAVLQSSGTARVADIGCGQGWSTVAIARAYPNAAVDGIDNDEASIADATELADRAGVADRMSFSVRDATDLAETGPYDLICIFEALHDMARPVEALAASRAALAGGGSVLLVDERVADAFVAPGDEVERMMYGWSVSHCLPASRAEQPSAALGTVLRADTVRELARSAGLGDVEVLPIENDFFRFYRLRAG